MRRLIADVLTFAKSIFNVQQPEYMSAPCSVSFALVADSTESNVDAEEVRVKDTNRCAWTKRGNDAINLTIQTETKRARDEPRQGELFRRDREGR